MPERSTDAIQRCTNCGGRSHLYAGGCPRNLHGRSDPFKTGCATCGDEIESNAPRAGDKYGNLYCDVECKSEGLETMLDDVMAEQRGATASV